MWDGGNSLCAFTCCLASSSSLFSFTLHARLLVMFPATCFCEDAVLLNFAIKAFQRSLKRLILADFDFRQPESPLSWPIFEAECCFSGW